MSRLRANQITNENANGAPNFPHGITVTGVVTATTSATTMSQIVVGSAVTANSNGVDTVGIVTAGTFKDKAGGTFAPNPTTTQGDLIVRGASANERLAIGAAGKVLKVNSSANGLEYGTTTTSNHMVLEQFLVSCDGTAVVTPRGSITIGNVTSAYLNTPTYADAPGSTISYNPPSGTTNIIYKYIYDWSSDDNNGIQHLQLLLDGTNIVYGGTTVRGSTSTSDLGKIVYQWGFAIGGSTNNNTGRQATWNSAKTIKLQTRNYSNSYHCHMFRIGNYNGGSNNDLFVQPQIGITAIGVPS